ncbi:craniofacial development protein 2-like [Montipora capricornis]|uniref:craniofacial development protein 2-like n=1 Tax=Montipora capricornis TaxID=246305 RepID=UPI0035F1160B
MGDGGTGEDQGVHEIAFGTWNVETLWRDGRLDELCHELKHYKWNVIGLSEVRRKALGEINSDDGNKLFYCGRDDKHEHGVGFLVHRDTAKFVLGCNFISSRLISIRIKASPFNITLFQAYSPTSDYSDEDIEIFYQDIQANFDKAQKKDIKIILGDFNARVRKDTAKDWPK